MKLYIVCCGVQDEIVGEDDIDFSAESHGDYFVDELQNVGLDVFGDNCATNKSSLLKFCMLMVAQMHGKYLLLDATPIWNMLITVTSLSIS